MNLIRIAVLCVFSVIACGCRGESSGHAAAAIIDSTNSLVSACIGRFKKCMAVKFSPKNKSSYAQETVYVAGSPREILDMAGIDLVDGEFRIGVQCGVDALSVYYVAAEGISWVKANSTLISRSQIKGRQFCYSKYEMPEHARGLKILIEHAEENGGAYVNKIDFRSADVYSFEISEGGTARAFMQSSVFKEGALSGEATPFFSRITPMNSENSFVAISTYSSLGDAARLYGDVSDDLLRGSKYGFGIAHDSSEVASLYSKLSLDYRHLPSNVGGLPARSIREIIDSGFVDCKEAVLIGLAIAKQNGVRAQAVLTGTMAPTPAFLFAPDWSWMNHVVIYFPDERKFLDLTADEGKQVIALDKSTLYGHMGVLVPSGDLVILK